MKTGDTADDTAPNASTCAKNTDDEIDAMMEGMDQDAAHKAATNFQEMLEALITVERKALEKTSTTNDADGAEGQQLLTDLVALSENTAKVVRGQSENEVREGMTALAPDGSTPMEPLMNVVRTFFAKDMMYPSIKQLHDAFPNYVKENADKFDDETSERYQKQMQVLGKICEEYETDFDEGTASQEELGRRFEKISLLMMELQSYGYPPEELTGQMPEGWQMDPTTGQPRLVDADKASEACSLM